MLAHLIRSDDHVIQIGALDGVSFDPLWPILRNLPLHTLRVEPHPVYFDKLKLLHVNDSHVQCENVAIGSIDGEIPLYFVEPHKAMPTWATGITTIIPDAKLLGRFASHVRSIRVRSVRFETLLRETSFPLPDVVVVDAEGFDLEIVEQVLSLKAPRVVMFEIAHYQNGFDRAKALMCPHGYQVIPLGYDVVCALPRPKTSRMRTQVRRPIAHNKLKSRLIEVKSCE